MWSVDMLKYLSSEAFGATLIALGFFFVVASVCLLDEINRPQGKLRMFRALRYFGNVVGCVRRDGTLYIKGDSPAVPYWEQRGFVITGVEHTQTFGIPQVYFVLTKCRTTEEADQV